LHLCFHDIDWVVENSGAKSCERARQQVYYYFVSNVWLQSFLGIRENYKSHTLVCRLFQNSRNDAFVNTSKSVLRDNRVDTLKQILVLGLSGHSIVNQLGFNRLLRSDNKYGFHRTSHETTKEVVSNGLFFEDVRRCVLIGVKSHGVFWHVKYEKGRIASIKAEKASLFESFPDDSKRTQFLFCFIKLHDRFYILGRICAGNFNRTHNTTYTDKKRGIYRLGLREGERLLARLF